MGAYACVCVHMCSASKEEKKETLVMMTMNCRLYGVVCLSDLGVELVLVHGGQHPADAPVSSQDDHSELVKLLKQLQSVDKHNKNSKKEQSHQKLI